jgi:hypothetical protein
MQHCSGRVRDVDPVLQRECCTTAAIRRDENALRWVREWPISIRIDRDNGDRCGVDDAFGDAPEEEPLKPASSCVGMTIQSMVDCSL